MFQRNIVNIVRDDKLICVTSLLQACEKHKLTGEWSLLLITAWHRQHVDTIGCLILSKGYAATPAARHAIVLPVFRVGGVVCSLVCSTGPTGDLLEKDWAREVVTETRARYVNGWSPCGRLRHGHEHYHPKMSYLGQMSVYVPRRYPAQMWSHRCSTWRRLELISQIAFLSVVTLGLPDLGLSAVVLVVKCRYPSLEMVILKTQLCQAVSTCIAPAYNMPIARSLVMLSRYSIAI